MNDTGRSRVYAAEAQVRALFDSADEHGVRTVHTHGSALELPVERRFASVESLQAYIDAALALNWVRAQWPRAATAVRVRARRGQGGAHYEARPPVIAVPLHAWALRELVVLHELAHHLVWGTDDGHGPVYVTCYTELVSEIVGPEAGFVLRTALHEAGA